MKVQIIHVAIYGLDGFAIAVESLVGQAAGARNRAFLRRAVIVSTISALVLSLLLGLFFSRFKHPCW